MMNARPHMTVQEAVSPFSESTLDSPGEEETSFGLTDIKTVGRYQIIAQLGEGASGVVYQGWDQHIKRNVAVKVLKHTSDRARKRFFAEAQSAGRLRHPGIVAVHDADVHKDVCFIAMEYVEGPTLEEFCNKDNLLPINKCLEIIIGACDALDYAHKHGVIHRDIKPSNIMLAKGDVPKITDFGVAQVTGKTMPFGIFGTPSYMSPEQLKDEIVESKSDIFSLGCVLYDLLTGKQAFSGENYYSIIYKVVNQEPISILDIRTDIPKILNKITKKALAKDPKSRYQTFIDLAYDLRVAQREMTGIGKEGKIDRFVAFVHRLPFFHNFTEGQIRELVLASSIIKVRKGNLIISEGEIDDTFYIVLNGKARVRKDDKDIALIQAGECFGEMAFIGAQARVANVMADTDCILMKISTTIFDRSSQPIQVRFFNNFARTLARRLSETSEKKGLLNDNLQF
jgi:serine/threonine-protein kinase